MLRTLFMVLLMAPLPASAQTLEDFSGNPAQRWDYFSDQVMGGVSEGQVAVTNEGLRLTGSVSTANNGGFIQARLKTDLPSGTEALRLRVKGNGERYYVHLRAKGTMLPWRYYQAGFDTNGAWQEVVLPLSQFTAEGGQRGGLIADRVKSVAVVAYGADYTADVAVTQISAE